MYDRFNSKENKPEDHKNVEEALGEARAADGGPKQGEAGQAGWMS